MVRRIHVPDGQDPHARAPAYLWQDAAGLDRRALLRTGRAGHRRAGIPRRLARGAAARRGRHGGRAAPRRPTRLALPHRGNRGPLRRRAGRPDGLQRRAAHPQRVRGAGRLPPGRADDRRKGEPLAALDLGVQRARHLHAARGLPRGGRGGRAGRADRRGLERQGLRRPGRASLPRGHAAPRPLPVRRLEGVHRPDRPLVCGHLRAAGRGQPPGQHLRGRRHELLAARAGHRPGAGRRASGPWSARTARPSGTGSTSRTRSTPT